MRRLGIVAAGVTPEDRTVEQLAPPSAKAPSPRTNGTARSQEPVETGIIDLVFAPDGPLAAEQPGFRPRPQQLEIARAVYRSLRSNECSVCEGPTGTGKTLAYSVPVALVASQGARVLLCAGTHSLLTQMDATLRQVKRALKLDVPHVLLRGRSNYACDHRAIEWLDDSEQHDVGKMTAEERHDHDALVGWLADGHRDLTQAPVPLEHKQRRVLVSTASSCRKVRLAPPDGCQHFERYSSEGDLVRPMACAYLKARKEALQARIVITTLAMFQLDLEQNGELLGEFDHIVIDEAHELPDAVLEGKHVEFRLSTLLVKLDELCVRIGKTLNTKTVLGPDSEKAKNGLYAVAVFREQAEAIWKSLANHAVQRSAAEAESGRQVFDAIEVRVPNDLLAAQAEPLRELQQMAPRVDALLSKNLEDAGEQGASKWVKDLAFTLRSDLTSWVRWVAARPGDDHTQAVLHIAPSFIQPHVRALIHERRRGATVALSATLSTAGTFDWALRELAMPEGTKTVSVESPFDYRTQALWYRPLGIPRYERYGAQHREYAKAVEPILRNLVQASQGGALVLCSAKIDFAIARAALAGLPYQLLEQGNGMGAAELARRFKEDHHACLIGSNSFGTGFDAPGDTLRLVVLMRLPWPRQSPIDEHNRERCEEVGVHWHSKEYEPRMLIRLRQWFGRLIRTTEDRGVFAILDPRANESLATPAARSMPEGLPITSSLDEVSAFFERMRTEARA